MSSTIFETPYTSFDLYTPHEFSKLGYKEFELINPKCLNFEDHVSETCGNSKVVSPSFMNHDGYFEYSSSLSSKS